MLEIIDIDQILAIAEEAAKADIYPRTGPTYELDTAAGHAVVIESGKSVYDFKSGEPLLYNKENLLNDWFIVR